MKVGVFERRDVVGGAAVTEEFHPGFRNSAASYTVSLLNPRVIRDLRLAERGLRIVERPFANFLPTADGGYLKVGGGLAATQGEIAKFSARDAQRLPAYYERLEAVADVLRDMLLETPPNVGGGLTEMFRAWKSARRLNRLANRGPARRARPLHDGGGRLAGTLVRVRSDQGLLRLRQRGRQFREPVVAGHGLCPAAPRFRGGERQEGHVGACRGRHGGDHAGARRGGPRRAAWTIRTGVGVERILEGGGRAAGLALSDGTEIAARCVVANANPKIVARLAGGAAWPEAFAGLPVRERHVPHERRVVGVAGLLLPAGQGCGAAPLFGNHSRAHPRLHGPCLRDGAGRRVVPRADRRGARSQHRG